MSLLTFTEDYTFTEDFFGFRFLYKNMKIEFGISEIDRSHRVGRPGSKPTQDLIVEIPTENHENKENGVRAQ